MAANGRAARSCRMALVLLAWPAAQALADVDAVVVTATRRPQSSAELPVSIDRIDGDRIQTGQLQVNLSETLSQVPGVIAQNRQNYAQDLQLAVRGFGARSGFGVRGIRLYADGIPGTMPDGQGQYSHFDLSSAGRIEVLRGPFSVLYGNSSGGVLAIFTEDGAPGLSLQETSTAGSLGTQRYALKGSGASDGTSYVLDAGHFQTDGYRVHSGAERNNLNGKLHLDLADGAKLTLIANAISTPFVDDPLGLTRTQLRANPTQAGTNAVAYNTRKSLGQEQAGAIYERPLGIDGALTATGYAGERRTTQYQAIPRAAQSVPTHPGGVIGLGRDYWGIDVHATGHYGLGGTPLQLTAGVNFDRLDEARRGYLNFAGTELGVEGALRRDEANRVYDFDQYLEAEWHPTARWRAVAGVRNSIVDVASANHLVASGGPAMSGVRYAATNPVAGITFQPGEAVRAYAAYGKGFETPTLNDLAYRSTDGRLPGLNLSLRPARSDQFEVGLKAGDRALSGTLAAFYVRTRDELAVRTSAGGRAVYQNIGATARRGAELGVDGRWQGAWSARLAYTYLHAVTAAPYSTCTGLPCAVAIVPADSRLPAVPASSLYAGLTWQHSPQGFTATVEAVGRTRVYVDDRNSDAAPGYGVANLHATWRQQPGHWQLAETLRIDNLTDRRYVGSVIVNESNGRYFEPSPGRTAYVGISAAFGHAPGAPSPTGMRGPPPAP
jgi:iron complex outermembrane receptor protein